MSLVLPNRKVINTERGNGAGELVMVILVLSILWSGFFWAADWIYGTKEARLQHNWELHQARMRSGLNLIDRGPGDYRAKCHPMFSKDCS